MNVSRHPASYLYSRLPPSALITNTNNINELISISTNIIDIGRTRFGERN